MKNIKTYLIVCLLILSASTSYASVFKNSVTTAKNKNKMLFLVCANADNTKKANKINTWVKTKKIRLTKKVFDYKYLQIKTQEQREELMMAFSIDDNDKGPFVCISDQNGNEFMVIKGIKKLNQYKKAVKKAKQKYKEVALQNKKEKKK